MVARIVTRLHWILRFYVFALVLLFAPRCVLMAEQAASVRNSSPPLESDPAESLFPGCATLKTDAEYERLLKRAQECVEEGRLELAVVLWQKVLEEGGGLLAADEVVRPLGPSSTPLVIYRPLRERIEKQLLRLPESALAAYRSSAEASARALLAEARSAHDEAALSKVVRQCFLSSSGGQADLTLAGLALDRRDFLAANRLLLRLLDHPDFSAAKSVVYPRLAVAAAHLKDTSLATRALEASRESATDKHFIEAIAAEVTSALNRKNETDAIPVQGWPMLFGNTPRTGQMPAIPEANISGALTESWIHALAIPAADNTNQPTAFRRSHDTNSATAAGEDEASRAELVRQWRRGGWRPTGSLLFDGGRVFAKSAERLECLDDKAASDQPLWQSAWENVYELDPLSRQLTRVAGVPAQPVMQSHNRPNARQSIWMFGDRVHQSMAIADGVVYSLEGRRNTMSVPPPNPRNVFADNTPRRARNNWLTAYQVRGGKAIWTRPAAEGDKAIEAEVGFLAAPIVCGQTLYSPVTDGGTIWLLALDKVSGKTIRKTFLCDEPQGVVSPWAEVVIAAEGSELYLTCGCGVLFAINTLDGEIGWAVRYSRDPSKTNPSRALGGGAIDMDSLGAAGQGWEDDVVIVHGTTLLLMASDSDRVLALDRRTGQRRWESPRVSPLGSAARYCLGTNGDALFVAGKNVIRKYDMASGRLVAEQQIADSLGRGCLTSTAILIPAGEAILKYELNLAAPQQIPVALMSAEPVGNLFSDGERLWVVGAGRIYALTTVINRLDVLAARIATGDNNARFDRAHLYRIQNQFEKLADEVNAAYKALVKITSPLEAAQRVLQELADERLSEDQPVILLRLVAGLPLASSQKEFDAATIQRKRDLVASALASLRQHPHAGAARVLLDSGELFDEDYLVTAAAIAMDGAATPGDAAMLWDALQKGPAESRLISISAASRLAPQQAVLPLTNLLRDKDDRVRLAAARALAGLGEPGGVLEALVELLGSSRVFVRSRAHQTLQAITGQAIPFLAENALADRAASIRAWRLWVAAHGSSAKLKLPLQERAAPLGRILIVSPNLLLELDPERKERWRLTLPGAAWGCEGLANGHRLVAINSHSMVIEYDDAGKEVWRKDRLPAPPTTVQRLAGGGTLIACGNAQQIVEVASDGSTTVMNVAGCPISAQRLDNGNTLVALQDLQRVVEVNSSGRTMWEIETTGSPAHACRLGNGNTLVTLPQARKVVEYDATGKSIVWMSAIPLIIPAAAQRLGNGNTLVADHTGILEIDPSGNQVIWRHRQPQAIGLSSF